MCVCVPVLTVHFQLKYFCNFWNERNQESAPYNLAKAQTELSCYVLTLGLGALSFTQLLDKLSWTITVMDSSALCDSSVLIPSESPVIWVSSADSWMQWLLTSSSVESLSDVSLNQMNFFNVIAIKVKDTMMCTYVPKNLNCSWVSWVGKGVYL